MSLNLGYAISSLIFLAFFCVTLWAQAASKRFHPFVYWAVVIATTTVGTTTSDYLDRTLKLGYVRSSILLLCVVLAILFLWRRAMGKIEYDNIATRGDEIFYWVTILVSNTLGTALGDFVATTTGLGFEKGALLFSALIAAVAIANYTTSLSKSVLFWAAYVLTRPLGATLGDTLTKPAHDGGLNLSRFTSSGAIAALMVVGIVVTEYRARRSRVR